MFVSTPVIYMINVNFVTGLGRFVANSGVTNRNVCPIEKSLVYLLI
jgi:hypothetical protein